MFLYFLEDCNLAAPSFVGGTADCSYAEHHGDVCFIDSEEYNYECCRNSDAVNIVCNNGQYEVTGTCHESKRFFLISIH